MVMRDKLGSSVGATPDNQKTAKIETLVTTSPRLHRASLLAQCQRLARRHR
jgi:hypothetical protein